MAASRNTDQRTEEEADRQAAQLLETFKEENPDTQKYGFLYHS